MGKIYDALERHKKEKFIELETIPSAKPAISTSEERGVSFAKEFCTIHDCSPKVFVLSAPDSVDAANFRILKALVTLSRYPSTSY